MGYVTVDDRGIIHSGLGAIFGRGDVISRYEQEGKTLQQIYAMWKPNLARLSGETARIPTGSGKTRLQDLEAKLKAMSRELDASMAPGATPGAQDRDKLNAFVSGLKDWGKEATALTKQYGMRPAAEATPVDKKGGIAKAGVGGIPFWGWALGLLALAKFAKKK